MTAARLAVELVHAWCEKKWPGDGPSDGINMASTVFNMGMMDAFDHVKMYDDSYVLKTCNGPLAWWSGKPEDKAEWSST